jgi:septum site-determining protein MinC
MTTLSTFTAIPSTDDVSLITKPGAPDVLALRTTNIPQVHLRLTELRQRSDHPPGGRPREVWIDLSQCQSFKEMRGEVLVRALRITQYLPAGFIGSCEKVREIAKSASLPRVDTIEQLPQLSSVPAPPVRVVPSAATIELEQQKDIAKDLGRRLEVAIGDHAELSKRYDVISRALCAVRVQRDSFENECDALRTQVAEALGKLEWSDVQAEAAEVAVGQALERLADAEQQKIQAQEQAQALEERGLMIERSLEQASLDVQQLRARVQELEVAEESQLAVIQELRQRVVAFDERLLVLDEEVQARETSLRSQVASLEERNFSLQAEIEALTDTLSAVRSSLDAERACAVALVSSRDEVMRESDLANKMLEDALARIEGLTSQSEGLYASLETQRSQWNRLNEEHEETRGQLAQTKQNLADATQSLIEAGERARANRQEIERLSLIEGSSSEARIALEQACLRRDTLELELRSAQDRVEMAEQAADTLREDVIAAQSAADTFKSQLELVQKNADGVQQERDAAVQEAQRLRESVDVGLANAASLQARIDTTQADNEVLQGTLMDASRELVQVQQILDEQLRSNRVLAELVDRQSADLDSVRQEASSLSEDLTGARDAFAVESQVHAATRDALEQTQAVLGAERTLHAATREALDTAGRKLLASEEARSNATSEVIGVKELLASEKGNHASTRLTLDQTRAVLEKLQEGFESQSTENERSRVDFEHRLAVSRAENDSLGRRLETSLRDSAIQVSALEASLTDVRAQSQTLNESCEQLSARLEEAAQEHALNQAEITRLNSIVEQTRGDLRDTHAQVRDREETIIEQESRIGELEVERDNSRVSLEQTQAIVEARDQSLSRLNNEVEIARQTVVQVQQDLFAERQACEDVRVREATASAAVERLSGEVKHQDGTILHLTGELKASAGREKEQQAALGVLSDNLIVAEEAARADRKSRAVLEVQLVDVQDELAVVRRQVEFERTSGAVQKTALHDSRVRSGQQLVSPGDLVVTRPVSSGAELVAEGSVHIYSAMQGRVHAGSAGDLDARIYCMNFAAEVVTIAGRYVVFEAVPQELLGRPVEIWFDRDRDCMRIEPLTLS